MEAYRVNFTAAVEQGNLQMAQAHRTKLVSYMDHQIRNASGSNAAQPITEKINWSASDLKRQQEIADEIRSLNLSDAEGLAIAREKLPLVSEFEQTLNKGKAETK